MNESVVLEQSSKNNIGRPRKYNKEYLAILSESVPGMKTERGIIELKHQNFSFVVVRNLYKKDPVVNRWVKYYFDSNGRILHKSILAALGRIEDEDVLISFAKQIAENKLSTIQSVEAIRRYRLNKTDQPTIEEFLLYLEKSINTFLQKHPSTTHEFIVNGLHHYTELLEVE